MDKVKDIGSYSQIFNHIYIQKVEVDLTKKYNRVRCENTLKQKFFYVSSFEIYGGVAGLYDYGPLGSMLKSNLEQIWRQHFVLEEDMLEVTCSNLTLDQVLETSVSIIERQPHILFNIKCT